MINILINKKGILLYIVMLTIVIVIILGNIMMSIILNQGRLTTHQISRVQAYYAAMAGVNLAYERLRNGNDANWPTPAAGCYRRIICRDAAAHADCALAGVIIDPAFPVSIRKIDITVATTGATCPPIITQSCAPPAGVNICISATADYLYTP